MEPQNLITPTDPITTIEPNDTILLANEIKLDSSSLIVVSGQIGDNPWCYTYQRYCWRIK